MKNVTPSTVDEEKRFAGTLNPLSMNDGALEKADADDGRAMNPERPTALGMMAGSKHSEPIGCVEMFEGSATPNEHENSKDWTDDVRLEREDEVAEERGEETAENDENEGATSKGAGNDEDEEESPGAALTSLSNSAY